MGQLTAKLALTKKQETAITALLTCQSVQEAAQQAGIGDSTLWRWLQEEEFQRQYRQAKREIVVHAVTRLQQASVNAVNTLEEISINPVCKDSARVAAAKTILEMAIKGVELEDLAARIEQLEELAAKEKKRRR